MDNQYFSDQQPVSDDELRLLTLTSRGHDLQMWVADGVFSTSRLDLGTQQLLSQAPPTPSDGIFLDLGCGWGPLAVTLGLEAPHARVWAVDVNSRARDLTSRNARINKADNVQVFSAKEALEHAQSDAVRFDLIWSNPPVRIGKAALHTMLNDWLSLLAEDGHAYLVVQRHLGADSLIAWLNGQGFPSRKIASKKGYRIIEVQARQEI